MGEMMATKTRNLPFDAAELNGDPATRLVATDWLSDEGRDVEVEILRSPYPVFVEKGRIATRFDFVLAALRKLQDWIAENTDSVSLRGCGWYTARKSASCLAA